MGNELKLSFENFQSISKGELIFHEGTNVIIGQSNSGKTATFRGLKACLSNPLGSQRFIKKGTTKSSVALEYNGNQIIWKRTPKESSYIINGEDFIKTGKSNAFKLLEDTGFVIDENETIMNIEEELQLPFPFGISKSELFKLYENVFCVSDSAIILKSAKSEEENAKQEIINLENDIIKNKNKLEELQKFEKEVNINFLKQKRDFFKAKLNRITFLKDGLDTIHVATNIQGYEVPTVSFVDMTGILEEKNSLKKKLSQLKELHKLSKTLKELEVPTTKGLTNYKELLSIRNECDKLKKLSKLEVLEKSFENRLKKYQELKEYHLALKELKAKMRNKKEELAALISILDLREEKLKEFKVCPLCHQPINIGESKC